MLGCDAAVAVEFDAPEGSEADRVVRMLARLVNGAAEELTCAPMIEIDPRCTNYCGRDAAMVYEHRPYCAECYAEEKERDEQYT